MRIPFDKLRRTRRFMKMFASIVERRRRGAIKPRAQALGMLAALSQSPEGAKQPVPPLQGLPYILSHHPGFQSVLPHALPPWALLLRAFGALDSQLICGYFRSNLSFAYGAPDDARECIYLSTCF